MPTPPLHVLNAIILSLCPQVTFGKFIPPSLFPTPQSVPLTLDYPTTSVSVEIECMGNRGLWVFVACRTWMDIAGNIAINVA